MILRTGRRSACYQVAAATLLGLSLAACGGGGGSAGFAPIDPPDDHGDAPLESTVLRAGGAVIEGSIDYFGDVDWFRFEGRPGVTYAIRADSLTPAVQPNNGISFTFIGPDQVAEHPSSVDTDLTGSVSLDVDFRVAMTPLSRATYYIRIVSLNALDDFNNYRWILTSSEESISTYRHILARDRVISEFDDLGFLAGHPVLIEPNLIQVLAWFFRFGDPDAMPTPQFAMQFSVPTITLTGNDEPEEPAIHIHLGRPAVVDTQPLIVPDDPNVNEQLSTEPHPIFFDIPLDGSLTELSDDVWHALMGHQTYIDIHASASVETVPAPLTSTPPTGGLSFFESEFRMTGAQMVPSTGVSAFDCTLLYLADLKTFQWDHTQFEFSGLYLDELRLEDLNDGQILLRPNPPVELVGFPINIRRGFPGEEGPIAIPLGAVVAPQQDGAGPGDIDSNNDIKNIQRVLTDSQVSTLRGLTYAERRTIVQQDIQLDQRQVTFLGWYIQIEAGGNQGVRYDAALYEDRFLRGYEVSITDPTPAVLSGREGGPVTGVEHLGEVTFVTDYADGGSILVSVDGVPLSSLNAVFTGDVPACGEGDPGETVRVLYDPGRYSYVAEAEDGTRWEGTVEVTSAGSCTTVALLRTEAL